MHIDPQWQGRPTAASLARPHRRLRPHRDLSEAHGSVPVVQLKRLCHEVETHTVLMQLESCNPTGSIKDKNAAYLLNLAESRGDLGPGGTVIESSSGNFGIALAAIGASRGYDVIIVVDPKTSPAMKRMLKAYGATLEEVQLSSGDEHGNMQRARMARAQELASSIPGAYYPCQHLNPDNPSAHYLHTGPDLLRLAHPQPDAVVVGVSTSGQLTGLARYLEIHSPSTKIIAVDVAGSVVLGAPAHAYLMTGLGLSFVPPNYSEHEVHMGFTVADALAFSACHMLAQTEGLLLGASTGAILVAALAYLHTRTEPETIVLLNPDRGDRYMETVYDEDWLAAKGLPKLSRREVVASARRLQPVLRAAR